MAEKNSELSRDRVFDILSSPRRRYVLHYLRNEENRLQLTDLAEHVAAWENDTTVENLSSQDRKRVYVSLYQTHIPKLSEAGLIEYDADSGMVALASDVAEIRRFMGEEPEEPPWYLYYMGLAVFNVILVVGATVGVPILTSLGETIVAILVVASFLTLTTIHAAYHYRGSTEDFDVLEKI